MGQKSSLNKKKNPYVPKSLIALYFRQIQLQKLDIFKQKEIEVSNLKIALQNKSFSSAKDKRHISYKHYRNITWLEYLKQSLVKMQKKYNDNFTLQMAEKINKTFFINETKYLGLVCWEYFYLLTKPACLKNLGINIQVKEVEEETSSLNDETTKDSKPKNKYFIELSDQSIVSSNYNNNGETIMFAEYDFQSENKLLTELEPDEEEEENELNSPVRSFSFQANFLREEPKMKYQQTRKILKKFMAILYTQMREEDHPINKVIKEFDSMICKELEELIEQVKKQKTGNLLPDFDLGSIDSLKISAKILIEKVQSFAITLQTTIKIMLMYTINLEFFKEERDETINLVMSLIFSNDKIYRLFYNLYELLLDNEIKRFQENLDKFRNKKPSEIGIKQRFSLDENTQKVQLSIIEDEIQKSRKNGKISNLSKLSNLKTKIQNRKNFNPYSNVISKLKEINEEKVPFLKMVLLANLSHEIENEVNNFWEGIIEFLEIEELCMDSDTLMCVFIYATVKSNFPEILIHLRFINDFTTYLSKNAMTGYYYSTIEASLIYINRGDENDFRLRTDSNVSVLKRNKEYDTE